MFEPVKYHHLETLKTMTLAVAGVNNISPGVCRTISYVVEKKTNLRISETTVKRLYGFAESKFNPSLFTLNTLATFCGYEGWNAFIQTQPDELTKISKADAVLRDPLLSVLMQTAVPTVILKTDSPEFTIASYNSAFLQVTHTTQKELIGLTIWEAFDPQKAGSAGPTMLLEAFHKAVYKTQPIHMEPLHYNIPSVLPHIEELCWWDVKIVPVLYENLVRYLVLHVSNITDKILHQDDIDEAILKELTMAEDLAISNVRLNVAVKKIAESHDEIIVAKKLLEETNQTLEQSVFERTKNLFESEAKQRQLIDNAPVAIGVLKGPDYVIETANKKMIDVWGKGNSVLNQQLAIALPEIEGQPIIALLDEVRISGNAYVNPELRGILNINGKLQARYFDLVYQPVILPSGFVDTIFVVAIDITDHVVARKRLQRIESMLQLAVSETKIGIWSYDPAKKILEYNSTLANILGWVKEYPMSYEQAIGGASEEFRESIKTAIRETTIDTGTYDFTYVHKRFNDNKLICLKATGKITTADTGEGQIFSGIISEDYQ